MVHYEKFKVETKTDGGKTTIFLKGIIDEDATFDTILKVSGGFVLNFSEVTSINSCGIRNWVNFIKTVSDRQISYEHCPPLIVRQLNMVPSFVGPAKVASVYAAYVCDACEHEKLVLVDASKFGFGNAQVEEVLKCDSCGKGEMEFDGHPKQYFAFSK